MQTRGFWALEELSDEALERNLQQLLTSGGRIEAKIVAHLAEVDARRLHLSGAMSLFEYCRKCLGFSESEAYYRICAARAGRRYPIIFELLERREIHLTALALLHKHLTDENHQELLSEARGKSKLQILESLARRFPRADIASHFRSLPVARNALAAGPTANLEPLAPARYRLELQTSSALKSKLELARDLMSHANPTGDLAIVIERALDALIEQLEKRRFGVRRQPPPDVNAADRAGRMCACGRRVGHAQLNTARVNVAKVSETQVTEAQLSEAEVSEAEVNEAEVNEAEVGEAQLSEAKGSEANVNEAEVSEGEVSEAEVSATRMSDFGQPKCALPADAMVGDSSARKGECQASATARQDEREARVTPRECEHQAPAAARKRQHIANAVRRQLLARDGLRCSFVAENGERCCARAFLQIDHVTAWSRGGSDTLDNLRLLCRAHNLVLAEREFGAGPPASAISGKSA